MRLGFLIQFAVFTLAAAGASFVAMSSAWARQDIIPGSRYTSARGASMGDAFLPLGDDGASALFYNPSLLSKLRSPDLDPLNLQFYGSSSAFSGGVTNIYKVTNLKTLQPSLAKNTDVWQGAGIQLTPTYSMRNFAFGLMAKSQTGAMQTASGNVRYRSLYQLVPTAGVGTRFAGGIIRLGYTIQWVNQASGDVTTPASSGTFSYMDGLSQGSALSHNVGAALTLPYTYLPSLNVVGRNIMSAKYKSTSLVKMAKNSPGVPPTEPMTIDVSLSLEPKATQRSIFNLVFEYRDATNQSKVSPYGHVALGAELAIRQSVYLRGGWGSGYPNAGIGIRTKRGEISLGWVAEDVGATYHEVTDRRYIFQYTVRAF